MCNAQQGSYKICKQRMSTSAYAFAQSDLGNVLWNVLTEKALIRLCESMSSSAYAFAQFDPGNVLRNGNVLTDIEGPDQTFYEGESISNQPNLFQVEIHLFFFDVIAL